MSMIPPELIPTRQPLPPRRREVAYPQPAADAAFVPVMTVERFATLIGLDVGVVEAQVDRGYWPTVRVGKRRLVNVEALRQSAAQRAREFAL